MKKTTKSILAKSMAVAMAFSIVGIAPNVDASAASKPSVTKKVSVKVGSKKTVKVTSKKKVKKTKWSLTKAGKRVASLSGAKATRVVVKGKKAGKATLTAKVTVGKKTYTLKTAITVTKKTTPDKTSAPATATPAAPTAEPTAEPTPEVPTTSEVTLSGVKYTIDETKTHCLDITELNETCYTSGTWNPSGADYDDGFFDEKERNVSFTSNADYNSGVSFYINPVKSEADLTETESGKFVYENGAKDVSDYDFLRIELASENEVNLRTYSEIDPSVGFPGNNTTEDYEGNWLHENEETLWSDTCAYSAGKQANDDRVKRVAYIPLKRLIDKGMNPATLTAIAICPQSSGCEVTIYDIDFVKVKYDVPVTGIEVKSDKIGIANGKSANLSAVVTPENATRQIVKWTSSDENLATVNYKGRVTAAEEGEGKVTITATATDGSGVTGSIEITIGEEIKVPSEDEPATPDTPDEGTVYEKCAVAPGLVNTSWGGLAQVALAQEIVVNPGDKVEIALSAKDANGDAIKDLDAQVQLSTSGEAVYDNRVDLANGQDPDGNWVWAKTDGKKAVLFNKLTEATTLKGIMFQTANASQAVDAGSEMEITVEKIVVTPAK